MKITRVHTAILPAQRLIALALVLALALAACGNQGAPAEPASTPTPVANTPASTDMPASTSTPLPTSTPTSLPTETPAPTPTDTSTPTPDAAATEQALATQQADQIVATIAPELEKLGLSVEDGYLAWFSTQPEEIRVFDYNATKFSEIGENLNLGDFILFTDITWESTEGYLTCGVIYRAEPEITKGEYYLFQVLRLSGLPGWDIEFWDGKQPIVNVSDHLQTNKTINQDQGATNAYMLVVQGDKMTVYANGARLRTQYDKRRAEGLPAFYAWQNSGESTCTFSNGWIWALK